jgi:uncharacterized protein (TIGR03000 family)
MMRYWLLKVAQGTLVVSALAFASGTAWGQKGHGGGHGGGGGEHHGGGGNWNGGGGRYYGGGWGGYYGGWGGYYGYPYGGRSLLWGGYGWPNRGYYGGYPYYDNYYGDNYYAPSNVVPFDSSSATAPTVRPQPSIDPNAVVISLRVPANAEVLIDGSKTSQTGPVRDFVTPPLETGRQFGYDIKARWTENGQPVERERHVNFHAGDRLMVNMMTAQANNAAATQSSSTPAYGAVP